MLNLAEETLEEQHVKFEDLQKTMVIKDLETKGARTKKILEIK